VEYNNNTTLNVSVTHQSTLGPKKSRKACFVAVNETHKRKKEAAWQGEKKQIERTNRNGET